MSLFSQTVDISKGINTYMDGCRQLIELFVTGIDWQEYRGDEQFKSLTYYVNSDDFIALKHSPTTNTNSAISYDYDVGNNTQDIRYNNIPIKIDDSLADDVIKLSQVLRTNLIDRSRLYKGDSSIICLGVERYAKI